MSVNADAAILFQLQQFDLTLGKHRVLHNINLTVRQGEKIAIIGPSGAGKSSLLEVLYRQQPQQIALCPQQGGLVDMLSVYNNIFMGGLERHSSVYNLLNLIRSFNTPRVEIQQLCNELGLEDKLWHSPDRLSGGQRQRVAVGRALYRQQPVFLGDEPVSALDPLQAEHILQLLIKRHNTLLVSLHNRRLALAHFDRVLALRAGELVYDGPAAALSSNDLDAFYAS